MKILFVRHGETDWNHQGKIQGGTDIPLNNNGVKQAEALREKLHCCMPDCIVSSPLRRALQTAEVIAASTNIPIEKDYRFKERNYGIYEGQLFSAVNFSEIWYPGSTNSPPGIEPLDDFVQRVADALHCICIRHSNERVLVVSHGGVSIAASILLYHTPQNPGADRLYINNGSIVEYEIN